MRLSYEFRGDALVVVASGRYAVNQLRDVLGAALEDARAPACAKLLLDDRVSDLLPTPMDLEHLAQLLQPFGRRIATRLALVVPDGLDLSLARSMAAKGLRLGYSVGLFMRRDEALDWLRGAAGPRELDEAT